MSSTSTTTQSPVSLRLLPGWAPRLLLVVLCAVALLLRRFSTILFGDVGAGNLLAQLSLATAVLLYVLWFAGANRGALWLRLLPAMALGLFVVAILGLGRFTGFSGDMIPQFSWRWAAKPELAAVPTQVPAATDRQLSRPGRDFPFYLGPLRTGVVQGVVLDANWQSKPPELLWQQPIGAGLGGFVVSGDDAIVLEQRPEGEALVCYELLTGQMRWAHIDKVYHGTTLGGEGPRSTPSLVDGRVYALGATGLLSCVDQLSGALLWQKDLLQLTGTNQKDDERRIAWGRAASPLVHADRVIVPLGGPKGAAVSLIAFHREDGRELWRAGQQQVGYASPQLVALCGGQQLLSVNERSVSGHQLDDGKELWRIDFTGSSRGGATSSQPVRIDDTHLFLSKGYGEGSRLIRIDGDAERGYMVTEVWHNKRSGRTKFSNPIPGPDQDGQIRQIVCLDERDLQAVDPRDGRELWRGLPYAYGQLLRAGEHVVVLAEDGVVALVDRADGRELGRFQAISGKTWSTPALAGALLLVRNSQQAACYRLPVVLGQ